MPAAHAKTACGAPVTIAASAEDEVVAAAPAEAVALLAAEEALEEASLAELDAEEAAELADPEAELALLETEPAVPVAEVEALPWAGVVDVGPPIPTPPVAESVWVPPPLAMVFWSGPVLTGTEGVVEYTEPAP